MDSGIRDNYFCGKIGEFLKEKIQTGSKLSIVSAYFTIHAYNFLKEQLDHIEKLNFLFGEPRFIGKLDPERTDQQHFEICQDGLGLSAQLMQKALARECSEWIQQKVDIRSIKRTNFLHGKLYHIESNGVSDAILGSSNFTARGLGFTDNPNIELNLEVDSKRDREDLYAWFQKIWNDETLVEDVKKQVLSYLEQLYRDNAPEFIYYKTLFHVLESDLGLLQLDNYDIIEKQLDETEIWEALYDFQKDGVRGAINKIKIHNGCIIADSVGLGKTYEALAIIKFFERRKERVLVLCPKKLKENWTIYTRPDKLNPFQRDNFHYTVLCHSDLSRTSGKSGDIDLKTFDWNAFDLVVIDESHNFRNDVKGSRDENGNIIRKSRYQRLMEDIIQSNYRTKVLMLSATPVNNNLSDLRNQIYFMTRKDDRAFKEGMGIFSILELLKGAQLSFNSWVSEKKHANLDTRDLIERLGSGFFKLLDEITIARSRKQIARNYQHEMTRIGNFPRRLKPISPSAEIDRLNQFPTYDELNIQISNYKLALFNPSFYIKPEFQTEYEQKSQSRGVRFFKQTDREYFLIGMMKVNFLKRLESSIQSFAITLERTLQKINDLLIKIEAFQRLQIENSEFESGEFNIKETDDEELQEAQQVGGKLTFNLAHLKVDNWLNDLKQDHQQLEMLLKMAREVTPERDAKLLELKKVIRKKIKQPTVNLDQKTNRKILIFTAFADTAIYLYKQLEPWVRQEFDVHIALVTGGGSENRTTLGHKDLNEILTNFSPVSRRRQLIKDMPQDEEIDILIATDCISEGQNLQDCDWVVNYDIHWNPVRLIQRFGRIDRIGSRNPQIQMINFWPTEDLEKYLNLKNRVEARMALVDITATGDEAILGHDQLKALISDDLNFRNKQLLRLKDEVLDLEDFNESINFSDFSLNDFRMDLIRYIEANKPILQNAPLGLYAVVPATNADPNQSRKKDSKMRHSLQPGVIFCLRHKNSFRENKIINPINPYFLVYINAEGDVKYSFTHPKQILEIFRQLCYDRKTAYSQLCLLFNEETKQGTQMAQYDILLRKAVKAITETFDNRNIQNLLSGRGGKLVDQSKKIKHITDFELITWLILM